MNRYHISPLPLALFALVVMASSGYAQATTAARTAPVAANSAQYTTLVPSSVDPQRHPIGTKLGTHFGGIFADGSHYGANLINPMAPAKYGQGEKYVAAPAGSLNINRSAEPYGLRGDIFDSEHRSAGGLKLLTFEF